jgi:phosphatidylserine decarboxylase
LVDYPGRRPDGCDRLRVPLTRYGAREIVVGSIVFIAAVAVSVKVLWPVAIPVVLLWGGFLAFFRDPDRHAGAPPGGLLSPADGTVHDVGEAEAPGSFLQGRAVRVGIFMSVFNVHVNRSPADGVVRYAQHWPGRFVDARHPDAATENEHNAIGIELSDGRKILVNQIAGAVARRIVCEAQPDHVLRAGQRYGMVKFGSRVELFVPAEDQLNVVVKPGDRVRAGVDVLAVYTGDATRSRSEAGPKAAATP